MLNVQDIKGQTGLVSNSVLAQNIAGLVLFQNIFCFGAIPCMRQASRNESSRKLLTVISKAVHAGSFLHLSRYQSIIHFTRAAAFIMS